MAPLARRSAASGHPAAAADRRTEAEGQAAADPAVGRRDAGVLGDEPGAAAQAAGGHLVPPDRDRAETGLGGERPRGAIGGIPRGEAAAGRRLGLCRRCKEVLGRQRLAGAGRGAGLEYYFATSAKPEPPP